MIRIFIGYDPREAGANAVLAHSLNRRSSEALAITPVALQSLRAMGLYRRETNPLASTDFSFSRFLAPYLCDFKGWAIFMDNDMLALDDIAKLWALRDERYAVQVVKHHHVPKEGVKFLDKVQTKYEKKNWSSVMLLNCSQCTKLTPDYVNDASGLELHQFKWLENDAQIGQLPHEWNHLVGYDAPNPKASLVHFTLGGPYFNEYVDCEFADEWRAEQKDMLHVEQRAPAAAKTG